MLGLTFDFQAGVHARIQIYWCRSSIFRHLKLELLTQFPASNDEKYINVVYIWRKFVSFYGHVHWRMTTEISVMYGSEKVNTLTAVTIIFSFFHFYYHVEHQLLNIKFLNIKRDINQEDLKIVGLYFVKFE